MIAAARRPRVLGLAALAVVAWLLPYRLNVYWISVADTALLFALLAVGMGLVMGIAGQVNLAQIAFFGVGAYVTAILTTHDGYGFWVAGLLAMAATVVVGLVVGTPALRIQSHYLGIVTLGLAVAFVDWITNSPVTGGDSGISGIPTPAAVRHRPVEPVPVLLPGACGPGRRAGVRAVRGAHAAGPPDAGDAGRRAGGRVLRRRDPGAADDRVRAGQCVRRRGRGAVRRTHPLHRAGDVQHREHVPAAGHGHHRRPAVAGRLRDRCHRAHHRPAGTDQPGRVRAARVRAAGRPGGGVRAVRAGRDTRRGFPGGGADGGGVPGRRRRWSRSGRCPRAGRRRPERGPAGGSRPGQAVPWGDRGGRRLAERAPRRDPRRSGAERVGQDHAFQRDQRALPAVGRPGAAGRAGGVRVQAVPDLPARRGPHVSAPAPVPQPDRAGEPAGFAGPDPDLVELAVCVLAVRGVAARPGAAAPGGGAADLLRPGPVRRRAAGRPAVRDPAPAGAGPRDGGRAAAAAARRAGRRAERRGAAAAGRDRSVHPGQRGHRGAHRAQHGAGHVAVRAGRRAGQRDRDRRGDARRGGPRPGGARGLPGQVRPAAAIAIAVSGSPSPTEAPS